MCVVSMLMDDWNKRNPIVYPPNQTTSTFLFSEVSRLEFDALKLEVEALKELLKAAKIYDEVTDQANCETESKIAAFKELAKHLDIDLEDLFED